MLTMTLYARQHERHSVKKSLLDSVGESKGGMIWENSIEKCIIICETDRQPRFDA